MDDFEYEESIENYIDDNYYEEIIDNINDINNTSPEVKENHNARYAEFFGLGIGMAEEVYHRQAIEDKENEEELISVKDYKYDTASTIKNNSPSAFNVHVAETIHEKIGNRPDFMEDFYKKCSHTKEVLDKLQANLNILGLLYHNFINGILYGETKNCSKYDLSLNLSYLNTNVANDLVKLTDKWIERYDRTFVDLILSDDVELATPQMRRLRRDIAKHEISTPL